MKRRIFSIFMALVLCIGLLPASVWAEETKKPWETESGWTALDQNFTSSAGWPISNGMDFESGNYYLTGDVTISTHIAFKGNVTLDLNGHTLKYDNSNPSTAEQVILLQNPQGGTSRMTLQDSSSSGRGTIDGNGQVNGVYVNGNCFFTMNGGTIKNCTRDNGGGVYVSNSNNHSSSFTMNDGTITNCTASNSGGGVYVKENCSFTMTGGSITGNSATSNGPDVFLYSSGTMYANGGTVGNICSIGTITRNATGTDTDTYTTFIGTMSGNGTIEEKAKLTVTFENCDLDQQKVLKGQKASAPDVTAEGYTLTGWYKEQSLQNVWNFDSDTVTSTMALYAKWTPTNYSISYDLDGGTVSGNPTSYTVETDTFTLKNPTRTGYTFAGWTGTDITGTALNVIIVKGGTGDKNYKATWTPNSYNITYHLDGGTAGANAPTKHTYDTATPLVDPTRLGYTFGGWYTDSGLTNGPVSTLGATAYTANITLYATWQINQYTITFDTDGGGEIDPIKQDYNTAISAPDDPTKVGHTFAGWDKTIPTTMPAENMTITAQWRLNQYAVSFDSKGGSAVEAQSIYHGTAAAKPADPTRSGYLFDGWYLDGEKYDFSTPVTGPITLVASWTPLVNNSSVTGAAHGTVELSPRFAETGDPVTLTATPGKGYALSSLTVTDRSGREIELTKNPDGTYSFRMPRGGVNVKAEFKAQISFVDVPESKYFHDAVIWAASNGITGGTDATHFSPYAPCSRAHAVTFLYRSAIAMGLDVSVGEDTNILSYNDAFDIPEYAIPAFQWACGAGILTGNNGNLNPGANCTRAQIAAFLWRFAKAAGMDVSVGEDTNILSYNDAFDVPEYAIPAFQWACGESVVTGNNGNLDPNTGCTRAQIVTFLYRLLAE